MVGQGGALVAFLLVYHKKRLLASSRGSLKVEASWRVLCPAVDWDKLMIIEELSIKDGLDSLRSRTDLKKHLLVTLPASRY